MSDHTHDHHGSLRLVLIALALTGSFMVVEVIGGLLSGSLALLADAGHMFTDTIALGLAAMAFHVSNRPPQGRLSYGYQRFQVLAAFVNGLTLLFIVGWILIEAVSRLLQPNEVMGKTMLLVALAGLVVNLLAFAVLHSGDKNNLNIRGATLHVVGDLLGSAAAIVAAIVILFTGWMPIDPILSVVVAMLILRSAIGLMKRSGHVLLEGAPEWFDAEKLEAFVQDAVPAVKGVHHVHVWGLTPQELLLTMHIVVGDADPVPVIRDVKRVLRDTYSIDHSTIEVERGACADEV